ncbi:MAG TPA: hypothetical protein VHV75_18080 [Solirubrobacteraceae bacterium]|jgi:cell wall-associated NlpC family hydrolase|nr:hypothetical protein [Solirubrobacteraceae bacterium]
MSLRQPTRQPPDDQPIPALKIAPRLQPAGEGPSISLIPSMGVLAGIIALLAAVAAAAAIFTVIHRSHTSHQAARSAVAPSVRVHPMWPRSRRVPIATSSDSAVTSGGARLVLAGEPKPKLKLKPVVSKPPATPHSTVASYTHDLSLSNLTSLADGASSYEPPAYLADTYRTVAARYQVPWQLLAAVEYIDGGYANAIAGSSSKVLAAVGKSVSASAQIAVNEHVLARAVTAAAQPSAALVTAAHQLAADGAAQSPGQAVYKFTNDSATTEQQALTLTQAMSAPAVTSSAGPKLKLVAMENEAKLLNGIPYSWGGGHENPAWVVSSGYDCSGFVSDVLHAAGYLNSPQTTQTLPGSAGILKGPGKYVTIYDRTVATVKIWVKKKKTVTVKKAVNPATIGVHVVKGRKANSSSSVSITLPKWVGEWKTMKITKLVPSLDNNNDDEHVIIDLDGQWWESGGSTADGGAAMVHPIANPSTGYLKSFNKILHPSGL